MHHLRRQSARPLLGLLAVWGAFFCTLPDRVPGDPAESSVPTGAAVVQIADLATVVDGWTSSTTLRTTDGWYATPVHATLLPDGRVLFTGIARSADPPTATTTQRRVSWVMPIQALGSPMAGSTVITEVKEPVTYDVPSQQHLVRLRRPHLRGPDAHRRRQGRHRRRHPRVEGHGQPDALRRRPPHRDAVRRHDLEAVPGHHAGHRRQRLGQPLVPDGDPAARHATAGHRWL